jgi:hypothetical protein
VNRTASFLGLFILTLKSLIFAVPADAYGQWVDCVIVKSAGLSPFPYFGSLAYEVKVLNGCDSDIGSVRLDFESGSFDVFAFNSQSIFNLSSFGKTVQFELRGIKPGFYSPTLKITSREDFSSKRVRLPAYTIEASRQPALGDDGGSATVSNKEVCSRASGFDTLCQDYPNWIFEMCSSLKDGTLQEYVGNKWVTLWKVKGYKDQSACEDRFPYAIDLSGNTSLKVGKTSQMRIVFKGTESRSGFTQRFTLSAKRM